MSENNSLYALLMLAIGFFIAVILSLPMSQSMKHDSYKQGQIDAINGIIKYKPKLVNDTVWIKNEDIQTEIDGISVNE